LPKLDANLIKWVLLLNARDSPGDLRQAIVVEQEFEREVLPHPKWLGGFHERADGAETERADKAISNWGVFVRTAERGQ
jgi:hypothetical protein